MHAGTDIPNSPRVLVQLLVGQYLFVRLNFLVFVEFLFGDSGDSYHILSTYYRPDIVLNALHTLVT